MSARRCLAFLSDRNESSAGSTIVTPIFGEGPLLADAVEKVENRETQNVECRRTQPRQASVEPIRASAVASASVDVVPHTAERETNERSREFSVVSQKGLFQHNRREADICQNRQAGACGDAAAIFPGAPFDQPRGQAACPCIIINCNGSIVRRKSMSGWGQKRRLDGLKITSNLHRSPDDFTVRRHVSNAPKRNGRDWTEQITLVRLNKLRNARRAISSRLLRPPELIAPRLPAFRRDCHKSSSGGSTSQEQAEPVAVEIFDLQLLAGLSECD